MENEYTGPERRSGIDRRDVLVERRADAPLTGSDLGDERRENVVDRRMGLDRRRGPGRRRSDIRKAAEEGEMSDDLLEFVVAIDEYKRVNKKPFPSWSEVFEVIWYLGYRKVAPIGKHIDRPADREQAAAESHPAGSDGDD